MFRPQEHVANSRVPVPFTAVWLNVPQHINKSDFLPTHQTQTQDPVVHDGRRFTISLLVSSDRIFMKCLLEEDSNCDQSMSREKGFCSESSTGRTHFKVRLLILGSISNDSRKETSYLVWCVNCRESVHKKPHRSIQLWHRAGGEGQIADCNRLSEHFT